MNRLKIAVIAASLQAPAALAQDVSLPVSFQGRIIELQDDNAVFDSGSIGQLVTGSLVFETDVDGGSGFPLSTSNFGISQFEAEVEGQVFASESAGGLLFNDAPVVFEGIDQAGPNDLFFGQGLITTSSGDLQGDLEITLFGSTDVFPVGDISDVASVDLQALTLAEVTIEFSVYIGDPDDLTGFLNPDNFAVSRAKIELLSFDNAAGNRLATVVYLADTNQNGEVDIGDFGAWLNAYNRSSYLADQNLDGVVNATDFGAWLSNFNTERN